MDLILAIQLEIKFISPAKAGSYVLMTCRYGHVAVNKSVVFTRLSKVETVFTSIAESYGIWLEEENSASPGYEAKVYPMIQLHYLNRYSIALLFVGDEDEGEYKCSVTDEGETYESKPKKLDITGH